MTDELSSSHSSHKNFAFQTQTQKGKDQSESQNLLIAKFFHYNISKYLFRGNLC